MDLSRYLLTVAEDDRLFAVVHYDPETVLIGMRWIDHSQGFAYAIVGAVLRGDAWSARIGGCPSVGSDEDALRYVWEEGAKMGSEMAYGFFGGGHSLKYLVHAGPR